MSETNPTFQIFQHQENGRKQTSLTKFFLTSVRWCTQESLLSNVIPRRRACFTHSICSFLIVTEIRGAICSYLIKSVASHWAEWGVKEFSWHQLFSSDKALFKEVTALSAVSPNAINGGVICVHKDRAGGEQCGAQHWPLGSSAGNV